MGECSTTKPVIDKGTPLPSQGLTAPAPPAPGQAKVRPPLANNDISKHSELIENNIATDSSVADSAAQFNINTIPRPVLVPVKPQQTIIPVKPNPPPIKHEQYHWNNKPSFNPRPPIQPYHLQGPPGAWNIVTSKPGSLPPPIHVYQSKLPLQNHKNEGIEIQLGPRLPLPPLHKSQHPFPPRRRPSTPIVKPPGHDILDMSTSNSDTSLVITSSTEHHLPATERVDHLPESDVIVIESNQLRNNISLLNENKTLNGSKDSIKNDILSDDQVTIFKVGPDNDIVRVSNDSNDTAENDTDTSNEYKFVILHKLPNGNAVNLENLKTYNYDDLIKGHSSVIEDANQEKIFDRENLEFFDVPRKVTNDRSDPYIIYQLPEKLNDVKNSASGHTRPSVQPVYKPVHNVHSAANNQTITNTYAANSSMSINTNQWIPKNKSETLSLDSLSELSQLAQVAITDNGPLKVPASVSSIPPKLNVQLLPPRLSAVLSHLDTTYKERDRTLNIEKEKDRSTNSRSVGVGSLISNHRQNKISPAFQLGTKPRDRQYARRIHNGNYVVTQPYQTQVIPSTNHRYIPLLHHPKMPLWWHPQDKEYQFPLRPHFVLNNPAVSHSKISQPPTVTTINKHQLKNYTKPGASINPETSLPYQDVKKFNKGPIYIISQTPSTTTHLPTISKQMNEENEGVSSLSTSSFNGTTFSADISTVSPMHNFTLTTEHLSTNVSSESYQSSQVFLGHVKSVDDQLIQEQHEHYQTINNHNNNDNFDKKELSENKESSTNQAPVSGN